MPRHQFRRTAGQSITIDGGIEIQFLGAHGQVLVEVETPDGVGVWRSEDVADALAAGMPLHEIKKKLDDLEQKQRADRASGRSSDTP